LHQNRSILVDALAIPMVLRAVYGADRLAFELERKE
jgi:hypothetical protein